MRIETAEHAQFNDGACIWQILRLREFFRDGELRSDPSAQKICIYMIIILVTFNDTEG